MHKSQPSHNGATNGQDQKCGSIGFWPPPGIPALSGHFAQWNSAVANNLNRLKNFTQKSCAVNKSGQW